MSGVADGSDDSVGASDVGPIGATAARTGGSLVADGRFMGVDGFAPSHFPGGVSVGGRGGAITTGGPTGVGCPAGGLLTATPGRRSQIELAV